MLRLKKQIASLKKNEQKRFYENGKKKVDRFKQKRVVRRPCR